MRHTPSRLQVLFYGTLTPRRAKIVAALRAPPAPLRVVHANAANNGTFGPKLDALMLDAKVGVTSPWFSHPTPYATRHLYGSASTRMLGAKVCVCV